MRKSARLLPLALRATCQSASSQLSTFQGGVLSAGIGPRSHFSNATNLFFRTCLSTLSSDEKKDSDDEFRKELRKIAHVVQLQQDLKHESELHDSISRERLHQLILDRGAARDEKDAEELVSSMQRAGLVVMHNKHIYLKPADLIEHRLPDFFQVDDLEAKLDDIRLQLAPYEQLHAMAESRSWRALYFACFVVFLQLVGFLRLTYWELSWDVMEPVGYMISLFYTLLGFLFFIYTRGHPFDLHPVKEWYTKQIKSKHPSTYGELDEERYDALIKARDRYSKRLKFLQKLESRRAATAASSS